MSLGNIASTLVSSIFKKENKIVQDINYQASLLILKTEEELQNEIIKIKLRANQEGLNAILTSWFAITKEISFRTIGLKHFDTQLKAGILLHQGNIVEMKTGEGKTLASTLSVSLNALNKKGVHVVTVNEYLAERDQLLMGKIYKGLGLTTGLVLDNKTISQKQDAYNSDITYMTNSQIVFDFLRDSSSYTKQELVQRAFNYCVVDEIDSVLIDEARTPLIISEILGENEYGKLYEANDLAKILKQKLHFNIDLKKRDVDLTNQGYSAVCKLLGRRTLYDEKDPYMLPILNALKANYLFKCDKEYIILDNKIAIVDEATGRVMPDRRWSQGIHEAIEVKENVPIGQLTKTKASITYQNFFALYPKLSGMSGTALTMENEFKEIYKLKVVEVPTSKSLIRCDLNDLVYPTSLGKWRAVIVQIKKCFETGQPILVGTKDVKDSELISQLLKAEKIPHQLLNAKPENVARESEIIALAGKRFAVTIATNMAGRGTDIILGGNPIFNVKNKLKELLKNTQNNPLEELIEDKKDLELKTLINLIYQEYQDKKTLVLLEKDLKNLPYSLETSLSSLKTLYNCLYESEQKRWDSENILVKKLGGLFILGTGRADSRRVDDQLRGRAGRQGDPGSSQFFISLEDNIFQIYGPEKIQQFSKLSSLTNDEPLEADFLTATLTDVQKKVEDFNFEGRKNTFQYDEILNEQRKKFYKSRRELLCQEGYEKDILHLTESFVDNCFLKNSKRKNTKKEKIIKLKGLYNFENFFGSYSNLLNHTNKIPNINIGLGLYNEIWMSIDLRYEHASLYDYKLLKLAKGKKVLELIDFYWTEHNERLNFIRDTISWRSYGQQNPLIDYNFEAVSSYQKMYEEIQFCMIYYFLTDSLIK